MNNYNACVGKPKQHYNYINSPYSIMWIRHSSNRVLTFIAVYFIS